MTTDAQLVAAARKDPDAFAELYRRHVHAVHAFLCLLHEKTLSAAEATSPVPVRIEQGALCTPSELTHAEAVALATLRAQFPAGTNVDSTKSAVDSARPGRFRRLRVPRPRTGRRAGSARLRRNHAGVEADAGRRAVTA